MLGMGLFSTATFYVALIYAFEHAGVSVGTVLLYLAPAIVVGALWALYGAPIERRQFMALLLALAGVALVSGVVGSLGGVRPLGVLFGVASACCYASFSLFGASLLRSLPAVVVVGGSLAIGTPVLWIVKLALDGPDLPNVTAAIAIGLVTGVGSTLAPLLLYTWGLSRLGPARASLLAVAEPVIAVTLAFVILGERLTAAQFIGAAAVLVSLVVSARPTRDQSSAATI
jgi:drug/metabolite transporter, DME family